MEGWVDLGDLIVPRPELEPTTAWSKVRRPNRRVRTTRIHCDESQDLMWEWPEDCEYNAVYHKHTNSETV